MPGYRHYFQEYLKEEAAGFDDKVRSRELLGFKKGVGYLEIPTREKHLDRLSIAGCVYQF